MKKILLPVLIPCMLILLQQCTEEDNDKPEKVYFTFSASEIPNGRPAQSLPEGASILVSLTNENGNEIARYKEIKILQMGESLLTEPLELRPGKYIITDFLVLDGASQVLFATPKRGSRFASLVEHSLPYTFYVSRNKVSEVSMDVVAVENISADALGYASFDIDLVYPWRLSVFAREANNLTLTDAKVRLEKNGRTISSFSVDDKVNLLGFSGDPSTSYDLVVEKKGFKTARTRFVYNELSSSEEMIVEVILQPNGMLTFLPEDTPQFWLTFKEQGIVYVDWGNGVKETIEFAPFEESETSYYYRTRDLVEPVLVTLYGDVDKLVEFASVSNIRELHAKEATAIRNITLENSNLQRLDLSPCTALEGLGLVNTTIGTLTLPDHHLISNVFIEGKEDTRTSEALLDYISDNILKNTERKNINDGAFVLLNVGEITAEVKANLKALEDGYAWYIGVE